LPTVELADGAITSAAGPGKPAAFNSLFASVSYDGDTVVFRMTATADAGGAIPDPAGTLAGAPVWSYVWPTTLDPATVAL
jgi:hypothetical protein